MDVFPDWQEASIVREIIAVAEREPDHGQLVAKLVKFIDSEDNAGAHYAAPFRLMLA